MKRRLHDLDYPSAPENLPGPAPRGWSILVLAALLGLAALLTGVVRMIWLSLK